MPDSLERPRPQPDTGPAASLRNIILGTLFAGIILFVLLRNFPALHGAALAGDALSILALALLAPAARGSGRVFVAIALVLTAWIVWQVSDAWSLLGPALDRASFIIAFFCALASLRHVANLSPAITRAAVFLASQPPGRRYTALTMGAQIFALILNYGSISLLGSMARRSADQEPDEEIRAIRIRRMMQAVHRGFAASLTWSPLAFAVVISTSIVPGADMREMLLPSLGSSALLIGIGWLMDTMFKPKISAGKVAAPPEPGAARDVRALGIMGILLLAIAVPAAICDLLFGLPPSMSVLAIVPAVSAIWLLIEAEPGRGLRRLRHHAGQYCFGDLPSYRAEIVLLSMAGFIGSAAGAILSPLVAQSGLDIAALPAWLVLLIPIIFIPLTGQLGMNPILCVALFGPLLPDPAAIGISPTAMVMSLTGGWAMSGVTSPFTASVLLVARLGQVPAKTVCIAWNGAFTLITMVALAIWVQLWA